MKKIVKFISGLFFIIFMIRCSPVPPPPSAADREPPAFLFYKKALDCIENQQYEKALALLDTAIAMKSEFAQFYYAQGQVYELLGNNISAVISYERALRYKSHYPDTWKKLAHLYIEVGQYEKASQMLTSLISYLPDSLEFELQLAESYILDGKPLKALERLSYYEKRGGSSIEKWRLQGMAYFVQGNYKLAVDWLDKYVVTVQENYIAQKYLGISCLRMGLLEKGISALNKALQMNPQDPEIYIYRAQYFLQLKKVDAAASQFQYALLQDDKNILVLLENSKFLLSQGDTLKAEELLQKAIAGNKQCWECYKYLGIIADEKGNDMEAHQYYENYLRNIYHNDPEVENRIKNLKLIKPK